MNSLKKIIVFIIVIIPIIFFGCFIDDVQQPATVEAGGVFSVTVTVTDVNAEQNNPHKGVLAILVPEDWSFIDGTYDTPMGIGNMEFDTSAHPVWGDVDTVIARPPGMKWINLLSDIGYLHDKDLVYESTINLRAGQSTGEFQIGYLVTVNTVDILQFLNDKDEDQELAGADTSMNHPVMITPVVGIKEKNLNKIPTEYNLSQNFPNPFNPSTTINYSIVKGSDVNITLYNSAGKEVEVLVDSYKNAGIYSINYSNKNLSSGIYYYRIKTNNFTQTRKMVLLK
ncbi:MAG: T9SS type A sorting domain-containing protein [Ignavibacteriaceae bacterium]